MLYGKKELKSFYACLRTIPPESSGHQLLSYHLSRNLLPPGQEIPILIRGHPFTPGVSTIQTAQCKHSFFLAEVSPRLCALEHG